MAGAGFAKLSIRSLSHLDRSLRSLDDMDWSTPGSALYLVAVMLDRILSRKALPAEDVFPQSSLALRFAF